MSYKKKSVIRGALFLIGPLWLFIACNSAAPATAETIEVKDINSYLSNTTTSGTWQLSECNCIESADTLYRNLPYTYQEAIELLNQHFNSVDSASLSSGTKDYIKALIISDFVYTAFSFQFMGPKYGLATDSAYWATLQRWDSLPLQTCYTIGNQNESSFYCGQRTSFYLRLVDSLLHIKGFAVIVPNGVHIYPVVNIAKGNYVMDPYDPFVICDSTQSRIVTYEDLGKGKQNGHYVPKRTRRVFGNSHQLFSKNYVKMLQQTSGLSSKQTFCMLLKTFLKQNEQKFEGNLPPCFIMPEQPMFNTIKNVHSLRNEYVMDIAGRVDGPLRSHTDIVRFYIGTQCDLSDFYDTLSNTVHNPK